MSRASGAADEAWDHALELTAAVAAPSETGEVTFSGPNSIGSGDRALDVSERSVDLLDLNGAIRAVLRPETDPVRPVVMVATQGAGRMRTSLPRRARRFSRSAVAPASSQAIESQT